jgi:uncharacterized RDD family membrane protein YckC
MGSRRVRDIEVEPLDNTTDVETPERIRFRHRVAGPVRRGLAYLLDLAIRAAVIVILGMLAMGAGGLGNAGGKASGGLMLLLLFVFEWAWNVLFETFWRGRTIGKRILGLRVVRDGGYPVGFIDSMLRNVMRAADFLPVGYVLGLLVMAGDRRCRRLGDLIAGTMVVIESEVVLPPPLVLSPPATAEELGALPHRPPLNLDEAEAIELFLRRPHLSSERRIELAEMIVPLLADRLDVETRDPVRFLAIVHQRAVGARSARTGAAPPAAVEVSRP